MNHDEWDVTEYVNALGTDGNRHTNAARDIARTKREEQGHAS